MKCIGEKCWEYYEGTFRFYCRLMGCPVNLESNCLISKYISNELSKLENLLKLEKVIDNYNILRESKDE